MGAAVSCYRPSANEPAEGTKVSSRSGKAIETFDDDGEIVMSSGRHRIKKGVPYLLISPRTYESKGDSRVFAVEEIEPKLESVAEVTSEEEEEEVQVQQEERDDSVVAGGAEGERAKQEEEEVEEVLDEPTAGSVAAPSVAEPAPSEGEEEEAKQREEEDVEVSDEPGAGSIALQTPSEPEEEGVPEEEQPATAAAEGDGQGVSSPSDPKSGLVDDQTSQREAPAVADPASLSSQSGSPCKGLASRVMGALLAAALFRSLASRKPYSVTVVSPAEQRRPFFDFSGLLLWLRESGFGLRLRPPTKDLNAP